MFEALARGSPLISAPWEDCERWFRPEDYLMAVDGRAMQRMMRELLCARHLAGRLAKNGLEPVRSRHTCRHRTEELLRICAVLDQPSVSAA